MTSPEAATQNLRKVVAEDVAWLGYAKAMSNMLQTPAWTFIEEHLKQQETHATNQMVDAKMDAQDLGKLQGSILMLRLLRNLPKLEVDKIAKVEKSIERNEEKIRQNERLRLDEFDPEHREFHELVRSHYQGARLK